MDSPTGGTGGSDSGWQSDSSYTDTGLQPNHQYSYRVQARDAASPPNMTAYSTTVSTSTLPYCTSASESADMSWVSRVQLHTGDQSSVGTTYSDYTSSVFTTLTRETSYTLSVTVSQNEEGSARVRVWIDWNQDLDFADAGEEIDLGRYWFNGTHLFSQAVAVPAGAVTGQTRMRVVLRVPVIGFAPAACGSYRVGETEDYTIEVVEAAPGNSFILWTR